MPRTMSERELDPRFKDKRKYLRDPLGLIHNRERRTLQTFCETDGNILIWDGEELTPCDGPVDCICCLVSQHQRKSP
jgi:hypothetical protein